MKSLVILLLQSCIMTTLALLCNHMNKKGESSPSQCRGYCTSISAITNGHSIKATYCVPSAECLATKSRGQLVAMGSRICDGVTQSIGDPSAITHCKAIVCQEDNCNNFKTVPGNLKTDCQISQCKHASCHNRAVGPTTEAVPTVANTLYSSTPPAMTYEVTEILTQPKKVQTQAPKPITEKIKPETLPPVEIVTRQRFLPTEPKYEPPHPETEWKSVTQKPKTEAPKHVETEWKSVTTKPVTEPKIMTEPKIIVTEPKIIATEPKVIVTEPKVIVTEPKVIVTEPKVIVTEPKVIVTEPKVVYTEPRFISKKPTIKPAGLASDLPMIDQVGTMSVVELETVTISTATTNPKFVPTEALVTSLDDIAHLLVTLTAAMNSTGLTEHPDYVVHITTELATGEIVNKTNTEAVVNGEFIWRTERTPTWNDLDNDSEFDYSNTETFYEKEGLMVNNAALNGSNILPNSSSSPPLLHIVLLLVVAIWYIS